MSLEVVPLLSVVKRTWGEFPRRVVASVTAVLVAALVIILAVGPFDRGPAFLVTGKATQLMPGVPGQLRLVLMNPHSVDVRVTSLRVRILDASRDCKMANLTISPFEGPVVLQTRSVERMSLQIELSPDAPDACQDVVFPLIFTGTAART